LDWLDTMLARQVRAWLLVGGKQKVGKLNRRRVVDNFEECLFQLTLYHHTATILRLDKTFLFDVHCLTNVPWLVITPVRL